MTRIRRVTEKTTVPPDDEARLGLKSTTDEEPGLDDIGIMAVGGLRRSTTLAFDSILMIVRGAAGARRSTMVPSSWFESRVAADITALPSS